MTLREIRNIVVKIHFSFLAIALLNFVLKVTIDISLNFRLAYIIILLVYASGIVLFIWSLRPFRKLAIYFSVYIFTPTMVLLLWMFGGIFLAILASIALFPLYPNRAEVEVGDYAIYQKFQGFMGTCCVYDVTEKKFLVLEKKITEIDFDTEIDFEHSSIESANGKVKMKIQYEKYDFETNSLIPTDTVISLGKE